jgi:hypothetical protein
MNSTNMTEEKKKLIHQLSRMIDGAKHKKLQDNNVVQSNNKPIEIVNNNNITVDNTNNSLLKINDNEKKCNKRKFNNESNNRSINESNNRSINESNKKKFIRNIKTYNDFSDNEYRYITLLDKEKLKIYNAQLIDIIINKIIYFDNYKIKFIDGKSIEQFYLYNNYKNSDSSICFELIRLTFMYNKIMIIGGMFETHNFERTRI